MEKKIKILLLNIICFLSTSSVFAQYANIKVEKQPQQIQITQIDFREASTLVYIKYVCKEGITYMNINEKTFIRPSGSRKKYPLINSINLPISMEALDRNMLFDYTGQEHCFVLEFGKLPDITKFDLIEMENQESAINFYGIEVDTTQVSDFMDMDSFIADYPVKEWGRYIKDDKLISWVKANDIVLTINVQAVKQYGKYYQVNMDLQNLCGKPILFSLNKINAEGYFVKEGEIAKTIPLEILSSYEYDKKVSNKQAWNNFWVALGEGMAASNAGYSSSTSTYSGSSTTTGSTHAYGYVGNTYGYASAYGSSYTTTYGQANTRSYNGAAAYAAQQNAAANYERFANSQYEIRQQLNEGYVKNNTIENEVEYSGFFNIKYKKLDHIKIEFVIDDIKFPFIF